MKHLSVFEDFSVAALATMVQPIAALPPAQLSGVSNVPTINDIAIELFKSRDMAHLSHLATDSFAKHKALEEYYTGVLDLLDNLIETWQGTNEEKLQLDFNITCNIKESDDVTRLVELEKKMKAFSANLSEQQDHIKNICEEISDLINRTIYKLKFLN